MGLVGDCESDSLARRTATGRLPDDDFDEAVEIAQGKFDWHQSST